MCVPRQPDGSPSTYGAEKILQRQFKYQLEIVTYVYLGFGMQVGPPGSPLSNSQMEEEEEEEEDLFVFNDTIEGPRAPAVKPGRITQAKRRLLVPTL